MILETVNPTMTVSNVQPSDAGSCFAIITNAYGFARSSNAVLTVTGTVTNGNCTPPPSGLVASWPAEGNANDVINGNDGTAGPDVAYAPAEVGTGFSLTGSSTSYVAVPPSSTLDVGTSEGFTIEGWVKLNADNPAGGQPIIEWDSDSADGLQFWSDPGLVPYANIKDTSGNNHQIEGADGSLSTTEFKHVVLTYEKTDGIARLYVNGLKSPTKISAQI
ncbi:MAG TPA: LamG-like jellyroll fold domain-containing protein [Candidatus Angelobacter sp.]|nr:LamG-like jellyroll fold domain-containing protein [Candidatus Angelobacter sp.]